jgi:6-phosphogluconolactonase (cycloisomerase 2 family)
MAAIAGEVSGNFLFGITRMAGDNHVYVFGINSSTGVLTLAGSPVLTQGSPYNLSVHPTGKWIYSLNREGVLGAIEPVEGFSVDASSGGLTPMGGSPFDGLLADGGPIDASGRFMFGLGVRADGVGTVTPYNIDQTTGVLSSSISPAGFPGIDAAAYAITNVK